ncbi:MULTISPECIES: septal ring lytic transglycosylase RlpA family protein [Halomonadaceae]|uniref:septal ring lytic transglycosylase RlpA family protein n=1 Tax=Halomonas sp. BMC7 TaxID=2920520 RepID=UPI0024AAB9FE|nr:septal ring lytic transglycosylase RlpA family protein [Halomonas sp. BMC7]MDI4636225.1 septal ring lytic transglycosylase RlpA family protein [Halomonas sp. BMC7]
MGMASYYADRYHGRTTASGERFDQQALTAAHRTLAFGTRVRVTRLDNGREVTVRINDRGPFVRGRIIDLSKRAARQLGMVRDGTVKVRLSVLR